MCFYLLQHFPDLLHRKRNAPRGLLQAEGEVWRRARQSLSPTFSAAKMKMVSSWPIKGSSLKIDSTMYVLIYLNCHFRWFPLWRTAVRHWLRSWESMQSQGRAWMSSGTYLDLVQKHIIFPQLFSSFPIYPVFLFLSYPSPSPLLLPPYYFPPSPPPPPPPPPPLPPHTHVHIHTCSTYSSFTMETVLATAFGRVIDLQRGEADQLTDACATIFSGLQEGKGLSGEFIILLLSELYWEGGVG